MPLVPVNTQAVDQASLELTVLGVMEDYAQWDYREVLANYRYDSLLTPDHRGHVW